MTDRFLIVGPGRMGLALGTALLRSGGADHLTFHGRSIEPPPHPIFDAPPKDDGEPRVLYRPGLAAPDAETRAVILAVPDASLAEVAYDLAASGPGPPGCCAFHLSGAVQTDVLEPLHARGYAVGSIHPLQSVADPWQRPDALVGIAFGISGEPAALILARRIIDALAGTAIVIPAKLRPRYHAAAVFASNYVVALMSLATRMLAETGISNAEALEALVPLVRTTVDNVQHLGILGALTGPVVRGDVDTVRLHLARLSEEESALYCRLGRELLRLARDAGLDPARAMELDHLFTQ